VGITIRLLLDTGSSGNHLFIKKGSNKYIPTVKRAIPKLWGTSSGTFQTKKVGEIDISFVEYSASKSVQLTSDIVDRMQGPMHLCMTKSLANKLCKI
jgi:hypothetical protein